MKRKTCHKIVTNDFFPRVFVYHGLRKQLYITAYDGRKAKKEVEENIILTQLNYHTHDGSQSSRWKTFKFCKCVITSKCGQVWNIISKIFQLDLKIVQRRTFLNFCYNTHKTYLCMFVCRIVSIYDVLMCMYCKYLWRLGFGQNWNLGLWLCLFFVNLRNNPICKMSTEFR